MPLPAGLSNALALIRDITWTTWPAWLSAAVAALCAAALVAAHPASSTQDSGAMVRELRPSPLPPHDYDHLLQDAARHLPPDVDWRLLKAIVWKESSFNPRARSHAGALGLMQLMPATARSLGLEPAQAFDPARNIDAGARYVADMLAQFSSVPNSPAQPERLRLALASYNWGIGNVRRALSRSGGPQRWSSIRSQAPLETRDYVQRVIEERLAQEQAQDHRPGGGPPRPRLPLPPR